ncbi:MarR family transcriptional regulator [Curtobacterium sp. MCLR17_007]|uniref:MarR family winged helix-turn-helix transcriptional regulator n=1 Tax=Curtobacterium sp. MCLR17_007 TaxID=2175648 RepID=UPI000DA756FB|nr:MarR family transcriptional regulator [Curtobacterium sp. MCLR17_007]WIB60905.1 MarR family transcriptional regulator [Curtobacterium sp. MCLR17_007]
MDTPRTEPDLASVARQLSAEIGPFRRALLTTARRTGALPDIPDAQIEVLRRLDEDGWSSPTQLGRALGLARSTVSNLVAAMQRDGLVDRRLATGDGRSTEVGLTELARERLSVYDAAAERVLMAAMGAMSTDAQAALAAALPRFAELRRALESRGPMVDGTPGPTARPGPATRPTDAAD